MKNQICRRDEPPPLSTRLKSKWIRADRFTSLTDVRSSESRLGVSLSEGLPKKIEGLLAAHQPFEFGDSGIRTRQRRTLILIGG
jgi:hypothetical protein